MILADASGDLAKSNNSVSSEFDVGPGEGLNNQSLHDILFFWSRGEKRGRVVLCHPSSKSPASRLAVTYANFLRPTTLFPQNLGAGRANASSLPLKSRERLTLQGGREEKEGGGGDSTNPISSDSFINKLLSNNFRSFP